MCGERKVCWRTPLLLWCFLRGHRWYSETRRLTREKLNLIGLADFCVRCHRWDRSPIDGPPT